MSKSVADEITEYISDRLNYIDNMLIELQCDVDSGFLTPKEISDKISNIRTELYWKRLLSKGALKIRYGKRNNRKRTHIR